MSRLRIMEAGDAARRRIERNLHDGAQQQLVAPRAGAAGAQARGCATTPPSRRSTSSPNGSRARWPSCASSPAASIPRSSPTAAWRRRSTRWPSAATLPVDVVEVPEERLPAPVEAAAYFLVAEALTNVARYARGLQRARRRRARGRGADRPRRRRWRRRRRSHGRRRPARARRPRGRGRRDAGDRQPGRAAGRGWRRGCRYEAARRAARARVRGRLRRDQVIRESPVTVSGTPSGTPAPGAPMPDGAVRIAVVTHGPASSKFWAIIRNGVDSAARRLDVLVDYQSPDVYSLDRMSALIDQAVATKPDGLVGLDPGARPGARDPAGGEGRHPGRLDQLRQQPVQVPRRARPRRAGRGPGGAGGGAPAGRRGRAAGAVHQPAGRQHRPRRPLPRPGAGDARGRRRLARARDRRRRPVHARPDRPQCRARTAPTAC